MERPEKPSDSDCCGSGCTPCVFDVYEQLLESWKVSKTPPNVSQTKLQRTDLLSVLKYKPYKLLEIEPVTENANIYTFIPFVSSEQGADGDEQSANKIEGILPYEPGQHFVLINSKPDKDTGKKSVSRSYTPISVARHQPNCEVKFLIKLYKDGAMSACISRLAINQTAYMRGAFGDFRHQPNSAYVFICAGTGIAPVYAIVRAVLRDETDETTMRLIFTCRTVHEIYFREEIRGFSKFWNFTSMIYVSGEETDVPGVRHDENITFGRISENVIFTEMSQSQTSSKINLKVLICGSVSFNDDVASYVERSGVSKDKLFVF